MLKTIKSQSKVHDSMMKAMGFPTLSELLGEVESKKEFKAFVKRCKKTQRNIKPH